MAYTLADIDAELAVLRAHVQSGQGVLSSVGADGVSTTYARLADIHKRIDDLTQRRARLSGASPMFRHGRIPRLGR